MHEKRLFHGFLFRYRFFIALQYSLNNQKSRTAHVARYIKMATNCACKWQTMAAMFIFRLMQKPFIKILNFYDSL